MVLLRIKIGSDSWVSKNFAAEKAEPGELQVKYIYPCQPELAIYLRLVQEGAVLRTLAIMVTKL